MQSGEEYVSHLLAKSETIFGRIVNTKRALDFGCGVGRLVIPFSKRFSEVIGVDISDSMIAEAASNCQQAGARNVSFVKSSDDLANVQGLFDFLNSYIVLQHIPVDRGMKIINGLLSHVAPGGHAMLHVSLRRNFRITPAIKYFVKHHVWGARQIHNILRGNPASRPAMEMNEYDLLSVIEAFGEHGLETFVVLEEHNAVMTARVMGRRMMDTDSDRTSPSIVERYGTSSQA